MRMPKTSTVVYLMENQPWESAFVQSFRKHQTGRLIGVAHSTVRFWDIRYFQDEREHSDDGLERIPYPDLVVTNAQEAFDMLRENAAVAEKVFLGEALRYGYLNHFSNETKKLSTEKRILILGDFLPTANDVLMRLVGDALVQAKEQFVLDIRQHPVCSFSEQQLGEFVSRVTTDSLQDLLTKADAIITTSSSSSAVESIMLGIPTIIVVDPLSLNYSPFRKTTRGTFVTTATELAVALDGLPSHPVRTAADYFCLDDQYPRWKGLIRSN
jgi:surface carbohydrate biosynthesis protein (TIGR04326 family)